MQRGSARDHFDHTVAARSPSAPCETAARAGSAQTPGNMEKMARYTATRPQIQSDFMKQSRRRVPPTMRAQFYGRRYPRDCVPNPPADCPRVRGPGIAAFRASVAVIARRPTLSLRGFSGGAVAVRKSGPGKIPFGATSAPHSSEQQIGDEPRWTMLFVRPFATTFISVSSYDSTSYVTSAVLPAALAVPPAAPRR